MKKQKIGFIGLGSMGSSLANRLLSQGYNVGVYNRTKTRANALAKAGAWIAKTPRELAEKSDVVLLCVTDDTAIRNVMDGKNGALSGASRRTVFIDCSTVSVNVTREMDKKTKKRGSHWLDAPVLGNPSMSKKGVQSFVVGGNAKILKKVQPILKSVGTKIVYMGGSGLGQAAKLVHNITCGIALVAYSEALVLGDKLGLKRKQTLEVLKNGATASILLNIKAEKFAVDKYKPTMAPLINMRKDLTLAIKSTKMLSLNLPETLVAKKLFDKAFEQGLGQQDTSSVIKIIKT